MTTTDTPRTDAAPIWKVCPTFNSALLEDEKEGERLNEILCATCDEAECLVELLNELTKRAEKAEAEAVKLRQELAEANAQRDEWAERWTELSRAGLNDVIRIGKEIAKAKAELVELNIAGETAVEAAKIFKSRAEKSEAEVERLKKPRYPFQTFRQFCEFLTSNNLIDEKAVSDPEGWDGGVELDRIEMAFDRVWKIIRLSQPDQPSGERSQEAPQ